MIAAGECSYVGLYEIRRGSELPSTKHPKGSRAAVDAGGNILVTTA